MAPHHNRRPRRTPTQTRDEVRAYIERNKLFVVGTPTAIKIKDHQRTLDMDVGTISHALTRLVREGVLVEHTRLHHKVRQFSLPNPT